MKNFRAPAVPLITVDPYFSIWSFNDKLYDDSTRNWTGSRQNMTGILTIDGMSYRFMGRVYSDGAADERIPVIPQTDIKITPMQSIYTFENETVRLNLTFMSPLLLDDLKLMSRPVSYISYDIEVLDGKEHKAEIFFGLSTEIAVNSFDQTVTAKTYKNGACCGRGDRDILSVSGDNRRIDWGWLHIFAQDGYTPEITDAYEINSRYCPTAGYKGYDEYRGPRIIDLSGEFSAGTKNAFICLTKSFDLNKTASGFICAAYDDIHSAIYFGRSIDAYYKKDGDNFDDVCLKALNEYDEILNRVKDTEAKLLEKTEKISSKYADIISLAYRQAIAAHKLTWDGEEIQFFSKECFSNGCMGTLDVTYPSIPLFLLLNPVLVEGMLNPLFKYVASGAWKFAFAPHDVGQYPIANGQAYASDKNQSEEYQMPVEECGNAILCVYAICHYKNDFSYFEKHFAILKQWADYLTEYGADPQNQLCTDDFAGHLAHNCNLSVKAIMGIAAFGKLLEALDMSDKAVHYIDIAKDYAAQWEKIAFDGDHYRLAFDQKDTWSLKYNMVWDKIFGWNIFDSKIFDTEISYYKGKFNKYGLPLDSRSDYTKSDWLMWTTRLTDDAEYLNMIINTMWDMLNQTVSRAPFTDWYFTSTAIQRGFQNRSVQGGLFINMI